MGASWLVLLATRSALAQPPIDPELSPHEVQIEAQAHFGVATTPFGATNLHETRGQAFVLVAGARYAPIEPLSFALHVPFSLGSVAQPAGSFADAAAIGNPQIGARYRFSEHRWGESLLSFSTGLDLGVPIASASDDLMPQRLLAIADGIEGRAHPEWFSPGVLPITPSIAVRWTSAPWSLDAELRLPLLARVSNADLASANTRALGLAAIVAVEGRCRPLDWLSIALAAHVLFDIAPATEYPREVSPLQDFERLSVYFHLGAFALAVDLQTAIGGELGGSTVAGGLRAVVSVE